MKKALGKGLSALIPDTYVKKQEPAKTTQVQNPPAVTESGATPKQPQQNQAFRIVDIDQVKPNRDQVRREFDPAGIDELAASIKEKGILQPVVVKGQGLDQYEIICGERRFRAAKLCGLSQIPIVIKDIADNEFLEWALIENIQRQDLNVLEEAEAFRRLVEERMLSQEQVAQKVGKSRSAVTNTLRLLQLPQEVRNLIEDGFLQAGHARALLSLVSPEHQRHLAKRIVKENLSVRQVEAMVNQSLSRKRNAKRARNLTPEIVDLEERLSRHFGTHVKLYPKKSQNQGRLEIQYFSLDDLDRILERMNLPRQ
ncbi:MAG: ParB/RepB/Spo0J family partition protein [Candidatus Omnitrophica bacterium]|nr:ParB/RepB/Spo0J family partition protein [Candidatus Omnitrophota bacterium]